MATIDLFVSRRGIFRDKHMGCTIVRMRMVLDAHELLRFPQIHSTNHHNKGNIL
jgi:hypothetical protein